MRKYLFIPGTFTLLLTLFSIQKLAAQNTSPYWSLAGNSTASNTTSKLGTTNAINLRLFTNNIERVHINASNGYAGIGTVAPTQRLHVAGNAYVVGNGYITSNLGLGTTAPLQKLHVVGNGYFSGNVGIGTTKPAYRLHVVTTGTGVYATTSGSSAIYGNSTNSKGYGVWGNSTYAGVYGTGAFYGNYGFSTNYYGVYGEGGSIGVWGYSANIGVDGSSISGYGVYGVSSTSYVSGQPTTGVYGNAFYGVRGDGSTGVWGEGSFEGVRGIGPIGVYGTSSGDKGDGVAGTATGTEGIGGNFSSSLSYGVYAQTGSPLTSDAGYFVGNVYSSGSYQGSDRKLKQNITDVTGAMDIINKLQPKYYEFRQDGNYKLMNLPQGKHYGLIAQDVEQVLPGLVKETEFDAGRALPRAEATNSDLASNQEKREVISFKALNYTELIPIMVKAMQEMNNENSSLRKDVNDLKDEIKQLKALINKNVLVSNGYDLSAASLEQNTPNPFNNATIIRYHLPESTGNAKVVITDMSGKVIKTLTLTGRGSGEINLSSGTLAAGNYNYTLWMDGKQVDSKKMVITK